VVEVTELPHPTTPFNDSINSSDGRERNKMDSNVGTTDIAAAREARDRMDATLWWKPKSGDGNRWGDNFIRILPAHKNMEGNFYFGIPMHFSVGPNKAIVPCPRQGRGEPCPICVEGFALRDAGKEEDGNRMLPNWAGYMNVVVLDENGQPAGKDPKVRVYSANRAVLDELLDIIEQKYGDITNLEIGHNINIRRKGEKFKTKYQVAAATEPSAFDHSELVESLHDLGKISPYRSFDTLKGLMAGEARKDPFAAVEAGEEKPAITGPVQQPEGMSFAEPTEEEEDARPTEADPSVAATPLSQDAAQEALRQSIAQGNDGS
jgi:hypothetical protein